MTEIEQDDMGLGLGEVAGLLYCLAKVSKEVDMHAYGAKCKLM